MKPWGYKLIAYVYVPGDIDTAMDISDLIASLDDERIDFMGIALEEVKDKPYDQGSS